MYRCMKNNYFHYTLVILICVSHLKPHMNELVKFVNAVGPIGPRNKRGTYTHLLLRRLLFVGAQVAEGMRSRSGRRDSINTARVLEIIIYFVSFVYTRDVRD